MRTLHKIFKKYGIFCLFQNIALIFWRFIPWPMGRGKYFFKRKVIDKIKIVNNSSHPIWTDVGWLFLERKGDILQNQIYINGSHYEREVAKFIREKIKFSDRAVVFDVGAHIGYYTLLISKIIGSKGLVISFEPQLHLAKKIKKSLEFNNITCVRVANIAVADRQGELTLFQPEDKGRTSLTNFLINSQQTLKVKTIGLDDYAFNKLKKLPSFIKIDIEGGELFAIRGMHKLLSQVLPILLIEMHPNQIAALSGRQEEIIECLSNRYQYQLYQIHHKFGLKKLSPPLPNSTTWHLFATPAIY